MAMISCVLSPLGRMTRSQSSSSTLRAIKVITYRWGEASASFPTKVDCILTQHTNNSQVDEVRESHNLEMGCNVGFPVVQHCAMYLRFLYTPPPFPPLHLQPLDCHTLPLFSRMTFPHDLQYPPLAYHWSRRIRR